MDWQVTGLGKADGGIVQELLDLFVGLLGFHYMTLANKPDITDAEREHWEKAAHLLEQWVETKVPDKEDEYEYDPDELPSTTATDGHVYDWIPEEGRFERHDGFVPEQQGIYMQLKGELVLHCKFPPGLPHTWPFPDGYWAGGIGDDGNIILFVD